MSNKTHSSGVPMQIMLPISTVTYFAQTSTMYLVWNVEFVSWDGIKRRYPYIHDNLYRKDVNML